MKHLFSIFLFTVLTALITAQNSSTIDYDFDQVSIGGGGYIIGMKIHPSDVNTRYFRTDIGGAYRWSAANQRLEQLIFYGEENSHYYGVAGIALDPNNPDIVIMAVGRYCDPNHTAILISYDRGTTWAKEIVPGDTNKNIYFASNGGRGCGGNSDQDRQGSPIALNPQNANELYIGSRGTGLWKLNIQTESFSQVAANVIPNSVHPNSIRNVVFHPTQPDNLFVAYAGQGIFRGNISNGQFSLIDGSSDLKEVSDLSISKDGTYMLMACKRKGIYRATNILSPAPIFQKVLTYSGANRPQDEAFLTVTCSPHDDDTAITVYSDWKGLSTFKVSNDSGQLNTWGNYKLGNVSNNIYPWHKEGYGSHISQIAFSPDDSKALFFTSWFSTYFTPDYTTQTIQWTNEYALGHEEAVITDISSWKMNAADNFLGVTGGDQTGFVFDSIVKDDFPDDYLNDRMDNPNDLRKGASIDYSFSDPQYIVINCVKEWNDTKDLNGNITINNTGAMLYSDDGGDSFTRSTMYTSSIGKSVVAVSSGDPSKVLIANRLGLQYSSDYGKSFTPSVATDEDTGSCTAGDRFQDEGLGHVSGSMINTAVFSTTRPIAADKVLSCVFYHYDLNDGTFHVSTDYGQSFFKVSDGLPAYGTNRYKHKTRINTIPGLALHVWINFNDRLLWSDNGGEDWNQLGNVQNAYLIAVGKQMAAGTYPTVFMYGRANNDSLIGFYRSSNKGVTWELINDRLEEEVWGSIKVLGADMNEAGQFYFGAAGLGLIYGKDATIEACDPINVLSNPSFENNYTGWQSRQSNGGQASFTINNNQATDGQSSAQVAVSTSGNNYWDIQIKKNNIPLSAGVTYELSFDAKISSGTKTMKYGGNTTDGNNFVVSGNATLTNQWKSYRSQFVMNSSENIYIAFNFGDITGAFTIDNVVLSEYCPCEDTDGDTVCDNVDQCPGYNDLADADGDGIPDACDIPSSCELVQNGDFGASVAPWYLRSFSGATGQLSTNANGEARIQITNTSNSNWHLGLRQEGLLLEEGMAYSLKLKAHADANRNIDIIISDENGGQYKYQQLSLSTTPTAYTIPFTMISATDSRAVISVNVATQNIDVYVDDISIQNTVCDGCRENLSIMNQTVWPATYDVSTYINSNGLVDSPESVIFNADEIRLLPDFEVVQGATFDAVISPCQ